SLEKRLGQQLVDRSGRRVEPTEAGRRLYRNAQRMLALEEQLLGELAGDAEGALSGRLEIGASTGPGGTVLPLLLCAFQRRHPDVRIALSVSDTQRVVDQVARRELELGVVGAARRHRAVVFEPFFRDEVVLACPPGHAFAGRTVTLDELREEPVIVMQEGAGVRQVIEDELRGVGMRLRDLDVRVELGLQESVRSAVAAGYGVTFISRSAIEADLSAATRLPLVSVPTTYAGAEWTPYFGIRDPDRRTRGGGSGARLAAAVYEPRLTLGLPPETTVGTAMNALAHSAEALYVRGHNPD